MTELTYATVCSGIECCSVACRGLPLRPVFFSEIEPFPCAVLKAHYPDVPNLGDMSKIQINNQTEITNGTVRLVLERPLDILAGGTPCQDVSVAGKRAGMQEGSGTRSSIAFDFVRLARELRPRWVIWENVAGSIDSKNAPDFLRFVGALGDCGYSLAWRVLDAQYVRVDGMERAVPQRRRRVWVVGCLGADESVPAQILFEPDCVAGHTAPRRRAGEGFAYSLAGRDCVHARMVGGAPGAGGEGCVSCTTKQMSLASDEQCAGPIISTDYKEPQCIALDGDNLKPREDQRKGGNGFGINEEGAGYTLTAVDRHGVAYGIGNGQAAEASITVEECSQTLNCMHDKQATVQCFDMTHADDPGRKCADGVSPTLQSRMGTGGNQVPLMVSMAQNTRDEVRIVGGDGQVAGALPAEPGMKQQTYVVSTAYKLDSTASNSMKSANPHSGIHETEVAACLDTMPPDPSKNQGGNVIVSTNSNGEDVAATLAANMSKLGGDNQTTFGGGYVVTTRQEGAEGE